MECPRFLPRDIDIAALYAARPELLGLSEELGFVADARVESIPGVRHSVLYLLESGNFRVRCDVHYDDLRFNHCIPFKNRILVDRPTLPLAELLMSKLQIENVALKDILSLQMLLSEHALGSGDWETINREQILYLCLNDWGLCRTTVQNLRRLIGETEKWFLGSTTERALVLDRARSLMQMLENSPKSLRWRLRAYLDKIVPFVPRFTEVDDFGVTVRSPLEKKK